MIQLCQWDVHVFVPYVRMCIFPYVRMFVCTHIHTYVCTVYAHVHKHCSIWYVPLTLKTLLHVLAPLYTARLLLHCVTHAGVSPKAGPVSLQQQNPQHVQATSHLVSTTSAAQAGVHPGGGGPTLLPSSPHPQGLIPFPGAPLSPRQSPTFLEVSTLQLLHTHMQHPKS